VSQERAGVRHPALSARSKACNSIRSTAPGCVSHDRVGAASYNCAMLLLLASFLAAFAATMLVVRSSSVHAHLSMDVDTAGPQKFHSTPVPRIGGVGILVGVVAGIGLLGTIRRREPAAYTVRGDAR